MNVRNFIRSNKFSNEPNKLYWLKLILSTGLILVLTSSGHFSSKALAQSDTDPFPGKLVVEGAWETIGLGHELTSLGGNMVLDWESATGRYKLWYYDPTVTGQADPFQAGTIAEGSLGSLSVGHRLTYLGGLNLLDWNPVSGRYVVQQYNPTLAGNSNPLSTPITLQGTVVDLNVTHKLIYLGSEKVLDWDPPNNRYRISRYDQQLVGQVGTFPGELMVEGVWPMIGVEHELVYLGKNRLLDWEPATGQYRIWRYEPMVKGNTNPLVGNPVAEGVWSSITFGTQLMSLGNNRLLGWEPATGHYRIWEYELNAVGMYSLEDIATNLAGNTVTGVTAITHGFQLFNDGGDSLMPLAKEIHEKAGGWMIDYDLTDDTENGFFDMCALCDLPGPGASETGEVVLLFDWAAESNETYTDGWGEAAGEALFNIMVGAGLVIPTAPNAPPLHFIGHSFGTAVTSEAVEQLARLGVSVDQVTYLDPHDFDQANVPVDESQRLFELGKPQGYGATVWNNVIFADVYYQTRGERGAPFIPVDVPNGRPIPGAYNKFLSGELPNPSDYPITDISGDHSYIWNCFYLGTVIGILPQDQNCAQPGMTIAFTQTGYALSRIASGQSLRPAPTFYGSDQDHKYSNQMLVNTATGEPNQQGLAALGLAAEDVTEGHWEAAWDPLTVINGNFQKYNLVPVELCSVTNTCPQPGWSHHGGGGRGHFDQDQDDNAYLVLDGGESVVNDSHTHNWLYIPLNATWLQFDLWRYLVSSEDKFEVYLGDVLLGQYQIKGDDVNYITRKVAIPESFQGQMSTITVNIKKAGLIIGSEVWVDNVRFIDDPIYRLYISTIRKE